jgi:hypothetical protein
LNLTNLSRDCSHETYHPIYGVGGAADQTVSPLQAERYVATLFEFSAFYTGPEVPRFRGTIARTELHENE